MACRRYRVGGGRREVHFWRWRACGKHFPGGLRESTNGARVGENPPSEALGWGAQRVRTNQQA